MIIPTSVIILLLFIGYVVPGFMITYIIAEIFGSKIPFPLYILIFCLSVIVFVFLARVIH